MQPWIDHSKAMSQPYDDVPGHRNGFLEEGVNAMLSTYAVNICKNGVV